MNFLYLEYLPGLFLAFVVFVALIWLQERRFFRLVKTYWFYRRSFISYVSTILFIGGIGLLLLALLDVRGPEEKMKAQMPEERTIILIDTSASMLAEDVKPSRLQKAALIAKHFARKATGHQLSVVAFAEVQKKIVPFTQDLDLIDARLESLKGLRNQYGSSALTAALQESIQYFREGQQEARGNIIVLTDGEETAESLDLKVPNDIKVALIGIGTTQGGRIPMDDGRGFRFGYKKNRGQDVITKLSEGFFKKVAADIPNAKYWIANSYTLPTDEIMEFFTNGGNTKEGEQDMIIRPVMMEWLVVPAILLLIAAYFLKFIRIFTLGLFLIIGPGWAQEQPSIEPELSPELIETMEDLKAGKLSQLEKVKLADELYRAEFKPEALALYEENLGKRIDPNIPPEAYMNYGTALLEKGDTQKGLATYNKVLESVKDPGKQSELKKTMEKNIVSHFYQQEQQKKQQEKDQQQKKDQGKNKDQQQNGGGQGQQDQNQSQSGQDQQKNQNPGQPQKDEKKGEDQKDDQKKQDKDEEKKDQDKDSKDGEKEDQEKKTEQSEGKKNLPPKKLPAKLKQLMSDDRQLQMKMIETGTRDLNKRKSRQSKDW